MVRAADVETGWERAHMERRIESVAVLGAGTMGSGIAALCASAGCEVLLLDVKREQAEAAIARMSQGRAPVLDDAGAASRITAGAFDADLAAVAGYDWICEAVVEDLATKRTLLGRVEPLRREGSMVTTNTSGIPLRDITEGLAQRLRRDVAVTHFFNPVKVMRLVELVPGTDTDPAVAAALEGFLRDRLGKGVVHAKDTVNFIGNRIGCFWMLAGLHKAEKALADGLSPEQIDALMGRPMGIPPTGLLGLIDLIGLDVMDLVATNLATNLPPGDAGHAFARLPGAVHGMLERGQLGRKSGGGFYRMVEGDDGSRSKETFQLAEGTWRPALEVTLLESHQDAASLLFEGDAAGRFAWDLMGDALCYAADLVPEIADDIVNVDRAMRWGFNWQKGPFELLDALGPGRVIARLRSEGRPLPMMLAVLESTGAERFYRGGDHLATDGSLRPVPA
jgi:3-hydroxyacyl-CoA dehydrogenase